MGHFYMRKQKDPNGALFIQNKLYICMQLVEQKNFEHDVTKTPYFAFAL